jgi:hypothetical protein
MLFSPPQELRSSLAMIVLATVAVASGHSRAANPTLITLASFNGTNGSTPIAGLIADAEGNLFGTTFEGGPSFVGGSSGDGTVFELAKTPSAMPAPRPPWSASTVPTAGTQPPPCSPTPKATSSARHRRAGRMDISTG